MPGCRQATQLTQVHTHTREPQSNLPLTYIRSHQISLELNKLKCKAIHIHTQSEANAFKSNAANNNNTTRGTACTEAQLKLEDWSYPETCSPSNRRV